MEKSILLADTKANRRFQQKINKKKNHPFHVVLMAMPLAIHAVKGALDMPSKIDGRVNRATEISDNSAISPWVAVLPATITALNDSIKDYKLSGPDNRDNFYRIMKNNLEALLADFQKAANLDPGNAIAILKSGKFKVVEAITNAPQILEVVDGINPGEVILKAPGGGPENHFHEWKISTDGINFVLIRSSSKNHRLVTGLPSGKKAYFTHELIIKDVPQGVSQVLEIMVK